MKPDQIVLAERLILLVSFVAMSAAVTAFDWRIGLFFAGAFLFASSLDLPWRRS